MSDEENYIESAKINRQFYNNKLKESIEAGTAQQKKLFVSELKNRESKNYNY
jgi:hypothetical protein